MTLTRYCILAVMLIVVSPDAQAGTVNFSLQQPSALSNQTLPVQWPSNSISWSQLTGLLSNNPGYGLYNIQFPNGTNWNVSSNTLQSIMRQANQLGYGSHMPDLSFSSTGLSNSAMVPISSMANGVDTALEPVLREMRYKEMNLSDSIPDWAKSSILWSYNALIEAYNYLHDKYIQYFD